MGADASPDDVRLAGVDFIAVLKGRPTVIGPSHLPNAGMALNTLHAEAGMKALSAVGEISNELRQGVAKLPLLLWTKSIPIAPE
jgi:hypothetical protein